MGYFAMLEDEDQWNFIKYNDKKINIMRSPRIMVLQTAAFRPPKRILRHSETACY
jgi:hypothetical protein